MWVGASANRCTACRDLWARQRALASSHARGLWDQSTERFRSVRTPRFPKSNAGQFDVGRNRGSCCSRLPLPLPARRGSPFAHQWRMYPARADGYQSCRRSDAHVARGQGDWSSRIFAPGGSGALLGRRREDEYPYLATGQSAANDANTGFRLRWLAKPN